MAMKGGRIRAFRVAWEEEEEEEEQEEEQEQEEEEEDLCTRC
jgi:Sec-independent protein translocase protein TatA